MVLPGISPQFNPSSLSTRMHALHQMKSGHDLAPGIFFLILCGSQKPSHSSADQQLRVMLWVSTLLLFLVAFKPSAPNPSSRKFHYCLNESYHFSWRGIFSHFYHSNKSLLNSFFMASPSFTAVTMTTNAVLSCFISSHLGFCAKVIMKTLH